MATIYLELPVEQAEFQSSAPAQIFKYNGTNAPVPALLFDASTNEHAVWVFLASKYGSGNLTCEIDWFADTATSGAVKWGVSIGAVTALIDTQDLTTKTLATEQTVTDSHLGTTAKRLHRASVTISNLDSLTVGDRVLLKVRRLADDAADTMSGDAALAGLRLSWSDV